MASEQIAAFIAAGGDIDADTPEAAAARQLLAAHGDAFTMSVPAPVEEAGGGSARTMSGRRGKD